MATARKCPLLEGDLHGTLSITITSFLDFDKLFGFSIDTIFEELNGGVKIHLFEIKRMEKAP